MGLNNINFSYFKKAIFAGMMIGVGGIIFLRCPDRILGSFMFSLGLLTIVIFQVNLFTGLIGNAKRNDAFNMIICLIGNYLGTFIIAKSVRATTIFHSIEEKVVNIVAPKLESPYLSLLILAVLCGALMYIAVSACKRQPNIIGVIAIFLCVSTFILSGFEHCIADMFYFNLVYGLWSFDLILRLLIIILGNTIGAKLASLLIKNQERT